MTVLPAPTGDTSLHPGLLRHRPLRRALAALRVVGGTVVWLDAATGPFSSLLLLGVLMLSGHPNGGWRLKELAYLIPLALIWAPGAAALVLPADPDEAAHEPNR